MTITSELDLLNRQLALAQANTPQPSHAFVQLNARKILPMKSQRYQSPDRGADNPKLGRQARYRCASAAPLLLRLLQLSVGPGQRYGPVSEWRMDRHKADRAIHCHVAP